MRPALVCLPLVAGLFLAGCTRSVDIANNDSKGLVDAIRAASASPGSDSIRLARNGLYILGSEAEAGLLLPTMRGKIRIEGNGAEIRGYSAKPAALLQVENNAVVTLENLVLAEGTEGAIRNFGKLAMESVRIVDSSVHASASIVLNHGVLRVRNSDIAYNFMLGNHRDAGTILNYGDIELERSGIHGNRALGRYPSVVVAGAILNYGRVRADRLLLENNELPGESPGPRHGGILNIGNGEFKGSTSSGNVRDIANALVAVNP